MVLEYDLESLEATDREASFGPHCGTARLAGDRVEVERTAYEEIGRRSFLVVDFGEGSLGFYTTGVEGYPALFPAVVDPHINNTPSPIATHRFP